MADLGKARFCHFAQRFAKHCGLLPLSFCSSALRKVLCGSYLALRHETDCVAAGCFDDSDSDSDSEEEDAVAHALGAN